MDNKIVLNLGSVDQVSRGQGRCFVVEGAIEATVGSAQHSARREVAVFRPRSGGIFALGHRCPHRQGPLADGIIGEGKVVCPLHGHKFDLESGRGSEKHECVRTFEVWEQDGEIILSFPRELLFNKNKSERRSVCS
jgi:nitrite reductase (NADH) small subunit